MSVRRATHGPSAPGSVVGNHHDSRVSFTGRQHDHGSRRIVLHGIDASAANGLAVWQRGSAAGVGLGVGSRRFHDRATEPDFPGRRESRIVVERRSVDSVKADQGGHGQQNGPQVAHDSSHPRTASKHGSGRSPEPSRFAQPCPGMDQDRRAFTASIIGTLIPLFKQPGVNAIPRRRMLAWHLAYEMRRGRPKLPARFRPCMMSTRTAAMFAPNHEVTFIYDCGVRRVARGLSALPGRSVPRPVATTAARTAGPGVLRSRTKRCLHPCYLLPMRDAFRHDEVRIRMSAQRGG